MKRLVTLALLFITLTGYAQDVKDYNRTKPSGKTNMIDAWLEASHSLAIPKGSDWSLKGAPDSLGYIFFNTTLSKFGVYIGSGVWKEYSTLEELNAGLAVVQDSIADLRADKVDKVSGKSLLSDTEITRLLTMATGATANSTDAQLRDRGTHTGNDPATAITQDATHRFVTDAEKAAWDAKQAALGYTPENVANKGVANGYASLNALGVIPNSQIPPLAMVQTYVSGSEAAMLALSSAEQGDVCIRTDLSKTFILTDANYSTLSSWKELLSPVIPAETDPGVPAYAKSLSSFSVIQASTDALYKAIGWVPAWGDVTGKPSFAAVATSGAYADLSGKPTLLSQFTNDPGYITGYTETDPNVPAYAKSLSAFSVIKTSTDALYEPLFSKNTAFNKNFGTAAGTVAQGDDSRINNGQTAYSWGNHSGLYKPLSYAPAWGDITGTVPTWNQNTTGTAANSTLLQNYSPDAAATISTIVLRTTAGYIFGKYFNQDSPNSEAGTISQLFYNNGVDGFLRKASLAQIQTALGITGGPFLPLTAGSGSPLSGSLYANSGVNIYLSNPGRIYLDAGYQASIGASGDGNGQSLIFYTGGVARYTIDASGNNTWTGSGTFGGNLITTLLTLKNTNTGIEYRDAAGTLLADYYVNSAGLTTYRNSAGQTTYTLDNTGAGVWTGSGTFGGALTGPSATFSYIKSTAQIDAGYVNGSNLLRMDFNTTDGGSIQSYITGVGGKLSLNPLGGNVGIGTANPINTGTNITSFDVRGINGSSVTIGKSNNTGRSYFYSDGSGGTIGTLDNIPLTVITNSTTALTIASNQSATFSSSVSATSFSGSGSGLTGTAPSLTAGAANSVAWANVTSRPTALSQFSNDIVYAWALASTKPSYSWSEITSKPTTLSAFSNDVGYITGISSGNVTTALGYTPVNPSSLATVATSGAYGDLSGRPTALSSFTNDLGNYGGWITGISSSDVTTALGFTPANSATVSAGEYTPTLTAVSNVSSLTSNTAHYIRIGNQVHVEGELIMSPTTGGTSSEVGISLNFSPDFSDAYDLRGFANSLGSAKATITADVTNGRASFYVSSSTGFNTYVYSFTYTIL